MTEVTLNKFNFALPTVVSPVAEVHGSYTASTEFPQEFFGLSPCEQVAVINGVIRALGVHVNSIRKNDFSDLPVAEDMYVPINIGIGISITRGAGLSMEAIFSLPELWEKLSSSKKINISNSIAYLFQASAISIVKRGEIKAGGV